MAMEINLALVFIVSDLHMLLKVYEGVLKAEGVTARQKRVKRAVHPYVAILVWKLFV